MGKYAAVIIMCVSLFIQTACNFLKPIQVDDNETTENVSSVTPTEINKTTNLHTGKEEVLTDDLFEIGNNGGYVVQHGDWVYYYEWDSNASNIYHRILYKLNIMSSDGLFRGVVAEGLAFGDIFATNDYIYVTYNTGNSPNLVRISVSTKEIDFIGQGSLLFIDNKTNEIYYSIGESPDEDNTEEIGIYKMGLDRDGITKVAPYGYSFLGKQDGKVYLAYLNQEEGTILARVDNDGSKLEKLATIPPMQELDVDEHVYEYGYEYGYGYGYEYISDFEIYDNKIIICTGRNISDYYFEGRIISMDMDGKNIMEISASNNRFEIIDGKVYYYDYMDDDNYGCVRVRLNLDGREELWNEIQQLYTSTDEGELIYQNHSVENTSNAYISDICLFLPDSGESVILFSGDGLPDYGHTQYVSYRQVEASGDYIYFFAEVHGTDDYRGHTCHEGYYRARKDGSGSTLLYKAEHVSCD